LNKKTEDSHRGEGEQKVGSTALKKKSRKGTVGDHQRFSSFIKEINDEEVVGTISFRSGGTSGEDAQGALSTTK